MLQKDKDGVFQKPVSATKLDILINLRNHIVERLTYAEVDVVYHPMNLLAQPKKTKDPLVQEIRLDSEQKLKNAKKTIQQDTLLLSVLDKQIAEQTALEEAKVNAEAEAME